MTTLLAIAAIATVALVAVLLSEYAEAEADELAGLLGPELPAFDESERASRRLELDHLERAHRRRMPTLVLCRWNIH